MSSRNRLLKSLLLGACVSVLGLGGANLAQADIFTVTKTADDNGACVGGDCSLREAIIAANAHPGADIITLPAGTYALTLSGSGEDASATGDLDITDDLTINGGCANKTIIDAEGAMGLGDRVLDIRAGVTAVISDLTITGGFAESGGGIFVEGPSPAGTLILNNSTVRGNTSYPPTGSSGGGGIWSNGALTLNNSTVSGNTAVGVSFGSGGGILSYHGSVTLNNSTVSGNVANYGGGIVTSAYPIPITLNNSTVTGNTAYVAGGGIGTGGYTTITLKNTIVAGNGSHLDCFTGPNDIIVSSYSLKGDGTCGPDGPGDMSGTIAVPVDPLLGLLADNGGPTKTHALLNTSPAIDASSPLCPPPATDQRGALRPVGAYCDIGAYEYGSTVLTDDTDGDLIGDACDNCPTTPNPLQEDINGNNIGDLCEAGYTPVGMPVIVNVIPGWEVTFTEVTAPGFTTVTTSSTGPPPPTGFKIVPSAPPIYYDLVTTATYTPPVTVCFLYDETQVTGPELNLKLFHRTAGGWQDAGEGAASAGDWLCPNDPITASSCSRVGGCALSRDQTSARGCP